MGDLTKNFSRCEFACKCGCGFDDIDVGLVNRLQVIRDIVGVSIAITSGCRCPAHNKAIDGKEYSEHLNGKAVDWHFADGYPRLLDDTCKMLENWSGGFKYYPDKGFCHVDVGPERRW